MRVHTIVDRQALQELKKYLLRPRGRKGLQILMGVLALVAVGAVLYGEFATTTICLFGVLVFGVEIIALENQQVKLSLKRLQELYGEDRAEGELVFLPEELQVINTKTGGHLEMEYSTVERLVESTHYYAMFTKEYQLMVVDKAQFDEQSERAFLQEIEGHMPSIRRINAAKKAGKAEKCNK